jgi:predicted dehydrogenase
VTRRQLAVFAAATALRAQTAANPIRVAMVGTGHGHAASKIRALQSMPEYEFVGLCRPDPDDPAVGDIFAKQRPLKLDEILNDRSIELVACEAADAQSNLSHAKKAVAAGKFVHLDKPPGSDFAGLQALLEDAQRRKLVVQMGYQWRYHSGMEAAIEAARKGWLGNVYRFRASIDKPILADERQHLAKYKGGMMFSEGCHLVDRATALLGKPQRVTGFIHHHAVKAADTLTDNNLVVLTYPNALAEISLGGFDPNGNQHRYVEILGTNGAAKAEPFAPVRLRVELKEPAGPYRAGVQMLEPPSPPGLTYTPDFAEMASIIRKGTQPTYSAAHDLMTHRVLLEACGMLTV